LLALFVWIVARQGKERRLAMVVPVEERKDLAQLKRIPALGFRVYGVSGKSNN